MIGLSLIALYANNPLVYQLVGWGWIGAAAVRLLAYLPDQPKVTVDYLVFLLAEVLLGIFLLW
jgi:cytochrome b